VLSGCLGSLSYLPLGANEYWPKNATKKLNNMKQALSRTGIIAMGLGVVLVIANGIMNAIGFNASYNLGDPSKFEFRLIFLWQIGAGLLVVGLVARLISRQL
jgi:uncharacterized protein YjeT (DUF2065 family)